MGNIMFKDLMTVQMQNKPCKHITAQAPYSSYLDVQYRNFTWKYKENLKSGCSIMLRYMCLFFYNPLSVDEFIFFVQRGLFI